MAFSLIVSRIKIKSARDTDDHYEIRQGYFIQNLLLYCSNFTKSSFKWLFLQMFHQKQRIQLVFFKCFITNSTFVLSFLHMFHHKQYLQLTFTSNVSSQIVYSTNLFPNVSSQIVQFDFF